MRADVMLRMTFGPNSGIAFSPDGRFKLDGDPGDCLWWAAGLRRLGPDTASQEFPAVRRLPRDSPLAVTG